MRVTWTISFVVPSNPGDDYHFVDSSGADPAIDDMWFLVHHYVVGSFGSNWSYYLVDPERNVFETTKDSHTGGHFKGDEAGDYDKHRALEALDEYLNEV